MTKLVVTVKTLLFSSLLVICMSGCSKNIPDLAQRESMYSDENISIYMNEIEYVQDNEKRIEKELTADISIAPKELSEVAKKNITAGEPVSKYDIKLSDGSKWGYDSMSTEPCTYVYTYETLKDVAAALDTKILTSNLAIYPESGKNVILTYDNSGTQNITIDGVSPILKKNDKALDYQISHIYRVFSLGPENHKVHNYLENVTEEAQCISYENVAGENLHILYDLSCEEGMVVALDEGYCFIWELYKIKSIDDIYEFADSLCWIEGGN